MNTRTVFVAADVRLGVEPPHFTSLSFYPRRGPLRGSRRECLRRSSRETPLRQRAPSPLPSLAESSFDARPRHASPRGLIDSVASRMALIDCPDCGRRVSDKAESCPACARPIAVGASLAPSVEAASRASSASSSRPLVMASVRPKRPGHVVAVRAPSEQPASPVATITAERRPVPTHVVVCTGCGEEEVLAFRASQSRGYLCVTCEEQSLYREARRRGVLQWWPVALIVVLVACGGAVMSWAVAQNRPPHDPVTPGEH